jgi:hypothetical protein
MTRIPDLRFSTWLTVARPDAGFQKAGDLIGKLQTPENGIGVPGLERRHHVIDFLVDNGASPEDALRVWARYRAWKSERKKMAHRYYYPRGSREPRVG